MNLTFQQISLSVVVVALIVLWATPRQEREVTASSNSSSFTANYAGTSVATSESPPARSAHKLAHVSPPITREPQLQCFFRSGSQAVSRFTAITGERLVATAEILSQSLASFQG
jgi:hypothetical protein